MNTPYPTLRFVGTCIFSASLFSLTAALIFFAWAPTQTAHNLPAAVDSVAQLSDSITPIAQ